MKPIAFHSPSSVPEALDLLSTLGEQVVLLAGGTDLVPQMRSGERAPEALISLRRIPELRVLRYSPKNGLRLGACSTLRRLTRAPEITEAYPCLSDTATVMSSEQVRSLATVGGNLCNGSPSADLAPPLLALGAQVRITGTHGERLLPLEDFFLGPSETALEPHEILTELVVPPPEGRTRYIKHTPRSYMDVAVVGVAVHLQAKNGAVGKVRIALGAVAPVPMRALRAEEFLADSELTVERIREAADLAEATCTPISDVHGSDWYRRRMVRLLVTRALDSLSKEQVIPSAI